MVVRPPQELEAGAAKRRAHRPVGGRAFHEPGLDEHFAQPVSLVRWRRGEDLSEHTRLPERVSGVSEGLWAATGGGSAAAPSTQHQHQHQHQRQADSGYGRLSPDRCGAQIGPAFASTGPSACRRPSYAAAAAPTARPPRPLSPASRSPAAGTVAATAPAPGTSSGSANVPAAAPPPPRPRRPAVDRGRRLA